MARKEYFRIRTESLSFDNEFTPNLRAPKEIHTAINKGLKKSAQDLRKEVVQKFISKVSLKSTGELERAIGVRESKYDDDGIQNQLVGVFKREQGIWENTVGARAVFFEYGRAYQGDQGGPKYQKPRPFIRPAMRAFKRRMTNEFKDII